jgi:hypothetical protein
MTTPWPPRRTARRPRVAAPREPVDPARIGRRVVRRRATGMDASRCPAAVCPRRRPPAPGGAPADVRRRLVRRPGPSRPRGAVAAALEEARFGARQDSRPAHLADDDRSRAELAEWERIAQLLAADAAAAAAREAELRGAARIAARADELQALRELGTLEQAEPREGDGSVRDELTRRAGGYVQGDVDAWLAHALAAHRGHYADPAAREAAADLLPQPVPGAAVDQLPFAARVATTAPDATADLAAFLTRATEPADTTGSPA